MRAYQSRAPSLFGASRCDARPAEGAISDVLATWVSLVQAGETRQLHQIGSLRVVPSRQRSV
jgi:hypothetical protein